MNAVSFRHLSASEFNFFIFYRYRKSSAFTKNTQNQKVPNGGRYSKTRDRRMASEPRICKFFAGIERLHNWSTG